MAPHLSTITIMYVVRYQVFDKRDRKPENLSCSRFQPLGSGYWRLPLVQSALMSYRTQEISDGTHYIHAR